MVSSRVLRRRNGSGIGAERRVQDRFDRAIVGGALRRRSAAFGGTRDGRGGWRWYAGSAAWMYRAGLESMLGLRRRGNTFSIDPCIPSSWPEYEIAWRVQSTRYLISVSNPERQCRGVLQASLDDVV